MAVGGRGSGGSSCGAVRSYGEEAYSYCCVKGPDEMALFYDAMSGMSIPYMREMLERYDGFKGVETLVDVGANSGVNLNMIMKKFPNILKGINYI